MAVVTEHAARSRRGTELWLLLLAVGVAMLAYGLVGVGVDGTWSPRVLAYGGGLAGLALVVHLVLRWRAPYADPVLLPAAVALNGLGLAMIHRLDLATGSAQAPRQLLWSAIGVVAATVLVVVLRDHRLLRRYTYVAMVASLVLLLLPLLPVLGRTINGARIWIGVGPLSFQPGEIAKITLAVFFAGYLVTARDTLSLAGPRVLGLQLPRGRDLGPILVAWAGSVGILVLQRDLGTSLLFFGLFVAVLYLATERTSWIAIGLVLFAAGAYTAFRLFGHVQQRVDGWLDPFAADVYDRQFGGSYQLVQGLFGLANGGLTGTGLGRGRPDIVPFANSDFILASIGEELGLVGLVAVLMLYLVVVERGLRTAIGVRDGFGKLLAGGLAFTVALQCFVVAGGVLRVIPLTGLTMPFLAAGGSSLLTNWLVVALLLRISDAARRPAPPVADPARPVDPGAGETQVVRTV
ncbi:FtsW/RodA/SpoVE family cell cycle protein [Pseudokineococcus lusitanus]|uniref:Cell elongation-specific peptidoglycan biosynthesis regulator RodA n=1 Tax=Pseudokineococcus lusitanus TaxID=763993 RepID=A0A3N1GX49_9ACTN|nr:FtsW/RodA/SpoVE family cell cycle protein [Pseudokineococcus lusitanus]ROP34682.1 cell elongation-specific peptidoglycan biosynthesis regulator RodA [Pseudokineococcus lusitanus]